MNVVLKLLNKCYMGIYHFKLFGLGKIMETKIDKNHHKSNFVPQFFSKKTKFNLAPQLKKGIKNILLFQKYQLKP